MNHSYEDMKFKEKSSRLGKKTRYYLKYKVFYKIFTFFFMIFNILKRLLLLRFWLNPWEIKIMTAAYLIAQSTLGKDKLEGNSQ